MDKAIEVYNMWRFVFSEMINSFKVEHTLSL